MPFEEKLDCSVFHRGGPLVSSRLPRALGGRRTLAAARRGHEGGRRGNWIRRCRHIGGPRGQGGGLAGGRRDQGGGLRGDEMRRRWHSGGPRGQEGSTGGGGGLGVGGQGADGKGGERRSLADPHAAWEQATGEAGGAASPALRAARVQAAGAPPSLALRAAREPPAKQGSAKRQGVAGQGRT